MEQYQERVVSEKNELGEKMKKLVIFMSSETFNELPMAEQKRMKRQYIIMDLYHDVLSERIENFT